MSNDTVTLTAQGFGDFKEKTTIEIPNNPIVVLNGPMGAGKSTFIQLLRRMLGDDTAEPEKTRGMERGDAELEAGGKKIRLELTSRFRRTGDTEDFPFRLAKGEGDLLADLIGPGDNDKSKGKPAKAARLRALAKLSNIIVTLERRAFLADKLDIPAGIEADIFAAAEVIKKALAKSYREHKALATRHQGEMDAFVSQLGALPEGSAEPVEDTSEDDAELLVSQAQEALAGIRQSHRTRLRLEKERKEDLRDSPPPEFIMARDITVGLSEMLKFEPEKLEAKDWKELEEECRRLLGNVILTKNNIASWNKTQAMLKRKIEEATAEDVKAAEAAEERAKLVLKQTQSHVKYSELETARKKAEQTRDAEKELSGKYKTASDSVFVRVGELIIEAGLDILTLDKKGEVVVRNQDGRVPFASRSLGERAIDAIRTVADAPNLDVGNQNVIVALAPWYYGGALDETGRDTLEMNLLSLNGRVTVLTEMPDSSVEGVNVT